MAKYSLYHEIRSYFKCSPTGVLLEEINLHNGPSLYPVIDKYPGTRILRLRGARHTFEHNVLDIFDSAYVLHKFELSVRNSHRTGLISISAQDSYGAFRRHFALILLMQNSSLAVPRTNSGRVALRCCPLNSPVPTDTYVQQIQRTFQQHLLFCSPENDQWAKGQRHFRQKVLYYVQSRSTVRFCLPAFPCKSTNPQKVASRWPDGADYEALTNIYQFCQAVQAVYPPGAVIEIVSDGHVFSDCVGVDDEVVAEYTKRLRAMAARISGELGLSGAFVTFQGLADILYPHPWAQKLMPNGDLDINNPLNTRRTP